MSRPWRRRSRPSTFRRSAPGRRRRAREGRYLGLGMATFSERTGYGTPAFAARGMEVTPGWETVELAMDPSGFIEARIGASPHGQGLRTTLSQIIADELGTSPDRIKIVHGDTDRTPYGWGTFASRSLVIAGGATCWRRARCAPSWCKMAGILLEASAGRHRARSRHGARRRHRSRDRDRDAGARRLSPDPPVRRRDHARHRPRARPTIRPARSPTPATSRVVEVDIETGGVRIEKFLVAEDAGRLINPMIVDGQIHGGVAQGIGNALLEEIIYDDTGNILTATLADYLPPTAHEMPPIEIHHLETWTEASITQAKGLGEGGAIGAPAAVVNAINDALSPFGVSIDEFPATPQRIRAALRAAAASAGVSDMSFVGRSVPRLEDRPLVTGRGRFAADVAFPHMLHMRVVRSGMRTAASCRSTRARRGPCRASWRSGPSPTSPTFRRSISA